MLIGDAIDGGKCHLPTRHSATVRNRKKRARLSGSAARGRDVIVSMEVSGIQVRERSWQKDTMKSTTDFVAGEPRPSTKNKSIESCRYNRRLECITFVCGEMCVKDANRTLLLFLSTEECKIPPMRQQHRPLLKVKTQNRIPHFP